MLTRLFLFKKKNIIIIQYADLVLKMHCLLLMLKTVGLLNSLVKTTIHFFFFMILDEQTAFI